MIANTSPVNVRSSWSTDEVMNKFGIYWLKLLYYKVAISHDFYLALKSRRSTATFAVPPSSVEESQNVERSDIPILPTSSWCTYVSQISGYDSAFCNMSNLKLSRTGFAGNLMLGSPSWPNARPADHAPRTNH